MSGRMKEEGEGEVRTNPSALSDRCSAPGEGQAGRDEVKSLISHPSSFILHPSSFVPVPGNLSQCELLAQPIDPQCPTTPWIVRPQGSAVDLGRLVGPAEYTAHLGANSGGANAVYWLQVQGSGANGLRVRNLVGKAKRRVEPVEAEIEPDLLYPLVRWGDVDRWSARPSAHLLLAQDPQTRTGLDEERFRRDYPRSFAYLKQFEAILTARAAYRRYQDRQPFYSMYNVGPYTLAAAKVIWRRMDRKIRAAVVESFVRSVVGPAAGDSPGDVRAHCLLGWRRGALTYVRS